MRGQAFLLDGHSYLSLTETGYFEIVRHNFSVSLMARFPSGSAGEGLLDWAQPNGDEPDRGIRLKRSAEGYLVFNSWPGGVQLSSRSHLSPDRWHHLAVTRSDNRTVLYVDGAVEASGAVSAQSEWVTEVPPLFIGAPGRAFGKDAARGWNGGLDEIQFFNRALTGDEIRALARWAISGRGSQ